MPRLRPLLLGALAVLAACGERPKTPFDGEQAYRYIATQMNFGPRVPGSDGHRRMGEWLVDQMRERADSVIVQDWTHVTAAGDSLPMRNVLARFRPEIPGRVLYLAHWDTRPVSENSPDSARRLLPVPGANDGASGTAILLALADLFQKAPPAYGVDLLFVDGEDYGDFDADSGRGVDVFIGSRHFAANLPTPDYRPLFGVLWDMVGDEQLAIHQEAISVRRAPEVVARVWETAREMGYDEYFIPEVRYTVKDDHVPLLDRGLRVAVVIDIEYTCQGASCQPNYHHTQDDTIDKVSARSLQIVGDVAARLVMP
ncbi:MAG TPA: M28 family peptidase [Gemmatimonadaceae bacterium]